MKEQLKTVDYAIRFKPDFRYRDDKLEKVPLINFTSSEPSVTDKEAYRITLASMRGQLAQGSGRRDVGSYSIKSGEVYDSRFDFSFLNRPDITIVELDNYIKVMKRRLEESDEALKADIQSQIDKAENLAKQKKDSSGNDSSVNTPSE